jgi:hypothetical protein
MIGLVNWMSIFGGQERAVSPPEGQGTSLLHAAKSKRADNEQGVSGLDTVSHAEGIECGRRTEG